MLGRVAVTAALLLGFAAAGCGEEADGEPTTTTFETTGSVDEYTTRLNRLCGRLQPKVLEVIGDTREVPDIAEYERERSELRELYASFDAKVDELDPGTVDLDKERFTQYRDLSDATQAEIEAAARGGDERRFAKVYAAETDAFNRTELVGQLLEIGISPKCLAR